MYNLHGITKRHLAHCPRRVHNFNHKPQLCINTRYQKHDLLGRLLPLYSCVQARIISYEAAPHICRHTFEPPDSKTKTLRSTNHGLPDSRQDWCHTGDVELIDEERSSFDQLDQKLYARTKPPYDTQEQDVIILKTAGTAYGALQSDRTVADKVRGHDKPNGSKIAEGSSLDDIPPAEDVDFTSSFFNDPIEHHAPGQNSDNRSLQEFVATRPKVDLSYQNLRQRELTTSANGRIVSPPVPTTTYREGTGLRQIVGQYMKHIEPLIQSNTLSKTQNAELHALLNRIFSQQALRLLEQRGFTVEDVVTWSWILSPDSSETSVTRFALSVRQDSKRKSPRFPLFIPLQLLRSPHINAASLKLLIRTIEDDVQRNNGWDNDSAAVLLIRLLRHARMVGVHFYDQIMELAPRVLPVVAEVDVHKHAQRLTHFYNRFLSLIALPLSRHPFLAVDAQQRAQLKIARLMVGSPLGLGLNREGYRALARVQLMHKKTVDEQLWSGVKAPSWPPWRRDELGIDAQIEYTGQRSRVSKVIKRLLEAGYGPESMEHEAQILAGWDTDKSPTIQVRRVTRRRPLAWLKNIFQHDLPQTPEIDHDVWAARVAATRSVREAWVCFYSYMQATMNQKRQLRVYHEMFYKLFARVQYTDQTKSPSPGDGKEVFPNPVSVRDHVYIPKEPPSVDELYGQMLQDGFRPTGRLLAGLLDSSHSVEKGIEYVHESGIGEVKKDVLLHPEKYPEFAIRKMLSTLPDYLLASYIAIFTKHSVSSDMELFWPGSRSLEERGIAPLQKAKPLHYCMSLLQIWQPTYMPAYHALLEGICIQAKTRQATSDTRRARDHSYTELWNIARHVLDLLRQRGLHPDLICYRKIVILLRNSVIRAPSHFGHNGKGLTDAVSSVKLVFAQAVHGSSNIKSFSLPDTVLEIGQQPYWKDVEAMIIILGFGRDYDSILDLVEWMRKEQEQLHCIDAGGYKMQRLICATRVALESSWSKTRKCGATPEQVENAKKQVQQWGWPEDVDVEEYLQLHQSWFDGMRAAARI